MLNRAYSILDVKKVSEDSDFVFIRGMASTPTPDRLGDVLEPLGARFSIPMPLLWQHDHQQPVGHVTPNSKIERRGPNMFNQTFVVQGRMDDRTAAQMARTAGVESRRAMART